MGPKSKLANQVPFTWEFLQLTLFDSGTQVNFQPGLIQGGELEFDCGVERCISYFLEPLVVIGPFCKQPLTVHLTGVTNVPDELSVDAIRATWLPVFSRFVLADKEAEIKVEKHAKPIPFCSFSNLFLIV